MNSQIEKYNAENEKKKTGTSITLEDDWNAIEKGKCSTKAEII